MTGRCCLLSRTDCGSVCTGWLCHPLVRATCGADFQDSLCHHASWETLAPYAPSSGAIKLMLNWAHKMIMATMTFSRLQALSCPRCSQDILHFSAQMRLSALRGVAFAFACIRQCMMHMALQKNFTLCSLHSTGRQPLLAAFARLSDVKQTTSGLID